MDGRVEPGHDAANFLHPRHVELRLLAGAVAAQRAVLADRVGTLKDPVLPGGEPGKDFRFHRLRPAETQVRLQAGEPVGREARALFEEDANFVLPVDVVEREGDEAELCGAPGIEFLTGLEANLRFGGPETMETKIFARLTAWQNWIFQRPNAVGEEGALRRYGTGQKAVFDTKRV